MIPADTDQASGWIAVARSRDAGGKPFRFHLGGQPYVLFRSSDTLHCLADRCPHRSAPLSGGRIVGGTIECPYHGWRFGGDGKLSGIPCHLGPVPPIRVPRLHTNEKKGIIFVSRQPDLEDPYLSVLDQPDTISMVFNSSVRSTVADVAENILDATHTHFTHKGILRGLSARRYRVQVTITGGDGWVEALYRGEPKQEGIVSRLLEGERSKSIARFRAPGIAEIEFWGKNRINLATTFHLRQAEEGVVAGLGILAGPRQGGLGYLKAAALRPFFRIALAQDRRILEASSANRLEFGGPAHVRGPVDVLRESIDAILTGQRPLVAEKPAELTIEL